MAKSERSSFVLQTQDDEESNLLADAFHERSPDRSPSSMTYSPSPTSALLSPLQTQPQQSRISRSAIAATAITVVVALLLVAGLVLEDEDLSSLKTQDDLMQILDAEAESTNSSKANEFVKDKSSSIVGTNPRIPNLHFVTYSNSACGNDRSCAFCPLIRSAHCAGARVWMLGRGNRTSRSYIDGCRQKLADVHAFLKDRAKHGLPDHEIMCFLDGHDTLILRSLHDFELKLREYMSRTNVSMVFNPEIEQSSLNSGVYCGEVAHVFKFIDEVMRHTFIEYPKNPDQQLIRITLIQRGGEFKWVGIDANHYLLGNNVAKGYNPSFCPLELLKKEELDGFIAAKGVEALPRGNLTGNFPYIMHHAGKSKDQYKNCGLVSCSSISAPYYDVDHGEEKFCTPLEVHTPASMNSFQGSSNAKNGGETKAIKASALPQPRERQPQELQPKSSLPAISTSNSRLHFVTYSNSACGNDRSCAFCPLIRSAHCAGARVWMLGRGNRTSRSYIDGCRQKLADVHAFLKDRAKHGLPDHEIMCFLDGHDTLILRSLHDFELKLREYMSRTNVSMVFNPEIEQSSLNSGVYCGEVAHVFKFIDEVMRHTFIEYPKNPDQQLIRITLIQRRGEFKWVGIDANHYLLGNNVAKGYNPSFCPLELLKKEELDGFIAAKGVEALPRGNLTGNFPYIMHHAGKSKDQYKNCGQVSCSSISAPYYDVDHGEEKFCTPLEVHTPVVMNPS